MPDIFDEARERSGEMLAENEQTPIEETPEMTEEAQSNDDVVEETAAQQNEEQQVLDNAVNTAEAAAQAAQQKDMQLQQVLAEIEELKQQNQQLQGTIDEMSRQNAENIVEEALVPPTLDINGLAFADEETQRSAMAQYAEKMAAYNRQQLMKELEPFVEQAREGMREKEKTEVVSALSQVPELAGIGDILPQLDTIIENNKWLQSDDMPMDEKLINAYAIARGVNAINTPPEPPKEPTTEELMAIYNSNPAFREMVEKQRLEEIKQSQQVPTFAASSGAVNAALNIKEKPKTFDEVLGILKGQI